MIILWRLLMGYVIEVIAQCEDMKHCVACRDYGTCDLAFNGQPGQYCPATERCCPLSSECTSAAQCVSPEGLSMGIAFICSIYIMAIALIVMYVVRYISARRRRVGYTNV